MVTTWQQRHLCLIQVASIPRYLLPQGLLNSSSGGGAGRGPVADTDLVTNLSINLYSILEIDRSPRIVQPADQAETSNVKWQHMRLCKVVLLSLAAAEPVSF